MPGLVNGVNLGGWLSQYPSFDSDHFGGFITEVDIARIAQWGFDHVRLPVDYPVIEDDAAPGVAREDGYRFVDSCVQWCAAHGLGVIIDLHRAPGFSFTNTLVEGNLADNVLFDQEDAQQRFMALWQTIARRYRRADAPVVLELLNEIVIPSPEPWDELSRRTLKAIREVCADVPVMIGGNNYNGAAELHELTVVDDPNVIYTFHFYHPMLFTHQRAYWDAALRDYPHPVEYPGEFPNLEQYLADHPEYEHKLGNQRGRRSDRAYVEHMLQPAFEFQDRTGLAPYLGEYGVAEWVDAPSRRRWLADMLDILDGRQMGRAIWSYKAMDFGLVDLGGAVVDQEFLDIARRQRG